MAEKNGNLWLKILLVGGISALALAAAWGGAKWQLHGIVTKDIPALEEADKIHSTGIHENEKAIIRFEGKMDTIRVQQEAYHRDSTKKLEAILRAVEP